MTLRVVVAGAGIGGLAAAIALRRAGHDVVVLEQADDVRRIQIGAGLQLWTNAMRAMQRLGLADAVSAVSSETEHFQYRTWRGKLLSDWPVAEAARRLGAPTVGISRPDLHEVLLQGAGDVVVRLGSTCTGFREDEDAVTVELAGGGAEQGDVLVGADGIASAVREQLLSDGGPRYSGVTSWRWVLPEEDGRAPRGLFQVMMGPGRLFILYRVGRGRPYSLAIVRTPEGTGGHDDPRVDLRQHFEGWPTQVGSLIEDAHGAARPTRADLYERPPQKQWGGGRVTLLGDAAHAMMPHVGQGAGTAIEDAVVLARCLGEAGADLPGALRAYEDERRGRTAKLQRLARTFGKINTWESGPARAARDALMRVAYPTLVWRMAQKDLDVEL